MGAAGHGSGGGGAGRAETEAVLALRGSPGGTAPETGQGDQTRAPNPAARQKGLSKWKRPRGPVGGQGLCSGEKPGQPAPTHFVPQLYPNSGSRAGGTLGGVCLTTQDPGPALPFLNCGETLLFSRPGDPQFPPPAPEPWAPAATFPKVQCPLLCHLWAEGDSLGEGGGPGVGCRDHSRGSVAQSPAPSGRASNPGDRAGATPRSCPPAGGTGRASARRCPLWLPPASFQSLCCPTVSESPARLTWTARGKVSSASFP